MLIDSTGQPIINTATRNRRHRAAFLGGCGVLSCDVCYPLVADPYTRAIDRMLYGLAIQEANDMRRRAYEGRLSGSKIA